MKKLTKSLIALLFCILFVTSSVSVASAAGLGKVTGLKATVGYNSVTLSWSAVSSAKYYQVQQYKSGSWATLTSKTAEKSYKVSSLKTGTTYKFRVRAYNSALINSSSWTEISAKPMPAKVTGLKATQYSANAIKLSWSKVSGATGYKVQIYKSSKWSDYKSVTTNSLTVSSLKDGTKYKFRVLAYRKASGTTYKGEYCSAVSCTCKLPAPKTVKIDSSTYDTVTIKWTAVENATAYQVYMHNGSTKKWSKVATGLTTRSYKATKLTAGIKYTFKVIAYQKISGKTYFAADSMKVAITPAVAKTGSVKTASLASNAVTVSWGKVTGATAYQVYTSKDAGKTWTKTATGVTGTSKKITLSPDTKYQIKVRAYRKTGSTTGYGEFSSVVSLTTPATKVTGVTLAERDDGVFVTYDKAKNARAYQISIWSEETNKWEKYCNVLQAEKGCLVTGLKCNTNYKIKVTPYVKNGSTTTYGGDSEAVDYFKKGFKQTGFVEGYAVTEWTPFEGAAKYEVQYLSSSNKEWYKITDTTDTTTVINVFSGNGMVYRVVALDENGTVIAEYNPITLTDDKVDVFSSSYYSDITWDKVSGAKYYGVYTSYGNILQYTVTTNTTKIYLEPGISKIAIRGFAKDPTKVSENNDALCEYNIDVYVSELQTGFTTSDEYYNEKVNAQLLYFVASMNRTKKETGKVTLQAKSEINYKLDKVIIGDKAYDTDGISALIGIIDPDMKMEETQVTDKEITFSGGYSSETGLYLTSFMEPSEANKAYLYDSNNPAAWKNGIKSFKFTKNANGTYTVNITLKKESYGTETKKTEAYYHPGFVTTVANLGMGTDDTMYNQLTTVGDTTITAVINAKGTLDSFVVKSPYTLKMGADAEGKSFSMGMTGYTNIDYTFTR